jgi:aminoglycoside/choline kinase family phosphotransferase
MKLEMSEKLFIEDLFQTSLPLLPEGSGNELVSIECLTGDASTRRYYRLFMDNQTSFVACLDNPTVDGFNYFVEVQKFFSSKDIRVPHIYDVNLERGYILQEDLGDKTLLQYLAELGSVKEEYNIYKSIIDDLLKLHKIDQVELKENSLFDRAFDYEKYMDEIEFTYKFFFEKFLKVDDEKTKEDFLNFYSPVCKRLAAEKRVLTHRDFHSRNVMVKPNSFIIIDFQDARMGIPQYDLVSLLEDSYYDLMGKNKKELIKYYYEQLPAEIHGQGDFENFYNLYKDMLLQRAIKAIGSFSYIYELRKDIRYIKYIGHTLEKIRKTMMDDSRYDQLRLLLSKKYYES